MAYSKRFVLNAREISQTIFKHNVTLIVKSLLTSESSHTFANSKCVQQSDENFTFEGIFY